MNLAKQSTAKSFLVGPILDTDGAAKTDEVVASIKVTKNGTVGAVDAQDTLTHNHTGHYVFASDGGDFDTLGEVEFTLNSGTNAMAPVKFQVVTANVYDSMCSTDVLDVSLTQINGTSIAGTSTQVVDAFLTKFNVASPEVNQTGDSYARLGSPAEIPAGGTATIAGNLAAIAGTGFASATDALHVTGPKIDTMAATVSTIKDDYLDTPGVIHVDVSHIDGNAINGTGAQIATAFLAKFDVATPEVNQTGDTYAALPTNFSDLSITETTGLVAVPSTQKVDVETIKTQAVTAAAGVTFPTSIASPTNITSASGVSLAADQSGVTIGTVTLVTTCTTNTDMRGTDSAALAATALTNVTWTDAKAGYIDAAISDVKTVTDKLDTVIEVIP